jgi:chlorite dismutase
MVMNRKQLKRFMKDVVQTAKAWKKGDEITIFMRDACNKTDDVWMCTICDTSAVKPEMDEVLRLGKQAIEAWMAASLIRIATEQPYLLKADSRHVVDQNESKVREQMEHEDWTVIYPVSKESK